MEGLTVAREANIRPADRKPLTPVQTALLFLGGLAIVMVASAVLVVTQESVYANASVYRDRLARLTTIERLRATLGDVRTSQEGFRLTGNRAYLEPYFQSIATLDDQIVELRKAEDNAIQRANYNRLRVLVRAQLTRLERIIALRGSAESTQANRDWRQTHEAAMEEIRTLIQLLETNESSAAKRLAEAVEAGRRIGTGAALVLVLAASGMLLLAYVVTRRDQELRRTLLDTLELEVDARTRELREANRRLRDEVRIREAAEAEKARYAAELERSNRELNDFAFVASHDLQEPLRKIRAFGDRISGELGADVGERALDYLDRMQNAAGRMSVLINDLLAFSRVNTRGKPFERVDLSAVAEELLEDLEVRIRETGAEVGIGHLPTIDADPTQMRQLLQNLLGNALKFVSPGTSPRISLSAEPVDPVPLPDDADAHDLLDDLRRRMEVRRRDPRKPSSSRAVRRRWRLIVEDNGIGFEEKYLDRLFTPLQRLHTRAAYPGSGIGLAICRRIAERHGGTIHATSQPGRGSRFIVEVPEYQAVRLDPEGGASGSRT